MTITMTILLHHHLSPGAGAGEGAAHHFAVISFLTPSSTWRWSWYMIIIIAITVLPDTIPHVLPLGLSSLLTLTSVVSTSLLSMNIMVSSMS